MQAEAQREEDLNFRELERAATRKQQASDELEELESRVFCVGKKRMREHIRNSQFSEPEPEPTYPTLSGRNIPGLHIHKRGGAKRERNYTSYRQYTNTSARQYAHETEYTHNTGRNTQTGTVRHTGY